jgi:hypothetical protein
MWVVLRLYVGRERKGVKSIERYIAKVEWNGWELG